MFRICVCLAMLLVAGSLHTVAAETVAAAPAAIQAPAAPKPSRIKLTIEKLKDMKAKWSANRGKLRGCRREVRAKGLVGDDRWFYIEDCMDRT